MTERLPFPAWQVSRPTLSPQPLPVRLYFCKFVATRNWRLTLSASLWTQSLQLSPSTFQGAKSVDVTARPGIFFSYWKPRTCCVVATKPPCLALPCLVLPCLSKSPGTRETSVRQSFLTRHGRQIKTKRCWFALLCSSKENKTFITGQDIISLPHPPLGPRNRGPVASPWEFLKDGLDAAIPNLHEKVLEGVEELDDTVRNVSLSVLDRLVNRQKIRKTSVSPHGEIDVVMSCGCPRLRYATRVPRRTSYGCRGKAK